MAAPSDSALLQAALGGDDTLVDAILARPPQTHSLACRLAIADPQAVAELDAQTVNTPVGPNAWPPLLYLLNSRYRTHHGPTGTLRLGIAKALLDLGADPNAGIRESETIRGYRTALGAAIGRARSPGLAKLLLESGADIADGPTLYEGSAMWEAARHRDIESLAILLAANPPLWHACHALPHCLAFDDVKFVRLLLDHDADPNWTMGTWGFKGNCLHEAVVLDTGFDVVEALLAKGADVHFPDRGGRTSLAVATCLSRETHATLLRQHGARDDEIRSVDHWSETDCNQPFDLTTFYGSCPVELLLALVVLVPVREQRWSHALGSCDLANLARPMGAFRRKRALTIRFRQRGGSRCWLSARCCICLQFSVDKRTKRP